MYDNDPYRAGVMRAYRDHLVSTLGYRIPAASSAEALVALAKKTAAGELEAKYGWRTEPPFPGATEEPEHMPTGWRMICACRLYEGDVERGVIFTTFVGGRPVAVFMHGPGMAIPPEYKPLATR
jgi:hypothetical protein